MNFQDKLAELYACKEARKWVGERTLEQAWAECPRDDWMLWLAERAGVDKRTLVGVYAAVARDALPLFEAQRPMDKRVRDCLDACDRYSAGEDIDLSPHRAASYIAYADAIHAGAAYTNAYANVAYVAASAASAAYVAISVGHATREEAQARHADIVRKMIPVETIKELMQ